jgi:hypothetical protein
LPLNKKNKKSIKGQTKIGFIVTCCGLGIQASYVNARHRNGGDGWDRTTDLGVMNPTL